MKISIVIPNHNGKTLLQKNLPKLIDAINFSKGKDFFEIVIVDDASTDNSVSYIKNQAESISEDITIKFFENKKNLGFSPTVNEGVKKTDGDFIILLNTDVNPEKDFIKYLRRHFDDPNVFAVGCLDKSIEDSNIILRGRGVGSWKKGFLVHKRGEVGRTNTLWVNGGSGMFRKSTWEKLGGMDELYSPFYWEDIDLSYRALKSGCQILFEPESIVVHEHEKGSINREYSQKKIKEIAYRNQFIFVWKNATDLDLQFLHLFWLPYHFLTAIKNKDLSFFIGFFKALILFPKIIKSSFKAQKYFVKKDRDVVREFLE